MTDEEQAALPDRALALAPADDVRLDAVGGAESHERRVRDGELLVRRGGERERVVPREDRLAGLEIDGDRARSCRRDVWDRQRLRELLRDRRGAGSSGSGDESFFDSRRTGPGWKPSFYINESAPLSALTVDRTWFHNHHSGAPAAAAAALFKDALRAQGVAVSGRATRGTAAGDAQQLAEALSPPLAQIVQFMDRESDNFTAELLLKQLGTVGGAVGTSAGGAAQVRATLAQAGIPLAGVRILDGSGLSPLDRLTARAIVGMLHAAWDDPTIKTAFVSALAVAGRSGTLKDRLRTPPARGVVLAKTGTTSIASALSGFVRQRYVFSVLDNGNPVSYLWARRAQDRFATVLAAQ